MAEIEAAAREHGMDVLVEVHNEAEMERAARLPVTYDRGEQPRFEALRHRSWHHRPPTRRWYRKARSLIAESGIGGHADVLTLAAAGAKAFLVGESLMRHADIAAATRILLGA